jgi:hypothetical protein
MAHVKISEMLNTICLHVKLRRCWASVPFLMWHSYIAGSEISRNILSGVSKSYPSWFFFMYGECSVFMKLLMCQVTKPLLETSRGGYLAAISASSYSYVSLLKYFLPIMNHGKKKILPILWAEMNSKAKLLHSGQYEWSYAKSLVTRHSFCSCECSDLELGMCS